MVLTFGRLIRPSRLPSAPVTSGFGRDRLGLFLQTVATRWFRYGLPNLSDGYFAA